VSYFTAYIDDSGTDPNQRVAIGTALVVPASRIPAFDDEWEKLKKKHGFSDFHTSEFVATNDESDFANWSEDKQRVVFLRVRQIIKKYGVKIYSFAVNKKDYNEVIPPDLKKYIGNHYSWAIRYLLANLVAWRMAKGIPYPLQYLFDWMEPRDPERREIEAIMEQAEHQARQAGFPGEYINYDFRHRRDHPGLQCVDALAWMFYQISQHAFLATPCHQFAESAWKDYASTIKNEIAGPTDWITATSIRREDLKSWIEREKVSNKAKKIFLEWEKYKNEQEKQDGNKSRVRPVQRRDGEANFRSTRGNKGPTGRRKGSKEEKAEG